MNRLKIIILNNPAGIFNDYVDVVSSINFLNRVSNVRNFSIIAVKGKKSLFLDRLDQLGQLEITKQLNDFQNQQ